MRTSHTLLLKYFHDGRYSFEHIEVCYIDRGATDDRSCVTGKEIVHLDSYYFKRESPFGATPIPYHRITKILYDGETIWERESS
jgi:uncharacterized protein